ncbi:MAG: GAF domain-containing protein [Pseudolabrys sp.]
MFRIGATDGAPPAYVDFMRNEQVFPLNPKLGLGLLVKTKEVYRLPDIAAAPTHGDKLRQATINLAGARTLIGIPMLKANKVIGAIIIYRQEVRPFTDKQIELVKNFADQAVIAIENTRLLKELRHRTDDLSESLEQQTATSDVLRVISSSPTNVQPVFDSIAESAVRLCDGQFSFVLRFDGKVMDFASCCGLSADGLDAFHSILPMPASEDTASGRAVVRRAVVEIPDVEADPSYGAQGQGLAKAVTYRSIAAVPLLNEGNPIGAIAVARANAGSFPKRQIVLLQAFADQAVIAIKNVRLFDEGAGAYSRFGKVTR